MRVDLRLMLERRFGNAKMRPGSENGPYSVFELQQDIIVRGGITAPAFGQAGGGVQYLFPDSMSSLLESSAIRRVP